MQNNALHHAQHGFIRGRSTCTNLIETLNDCTLVLQYKGSVTVTYIDFSKAYDSVSHNKNSLSNLRAMAFVAAYTYVDQKST